MPFPGVPTTIPGMELPRAPWPFSGLVLRSPRLELRPDDDAGLIELAELAAAGIHPPERMPFAYPWTDAPAEELGPNLMRFHWEQRARCSAAEWHLHFLVRRDGQVIGSQGLSAVDFAVTREVSTGSWLGRRIQGQGHGTEMRAAVPMFAFDVLGAEQARSGAFTDNEQSLRVSEKLGYQSDGTQRKSVRGRLAIEQRLLLTVARFADHRPGWRLEIDGVEACLPLLTGSS